jgi:hypothetical protein
MLVDDNLDVPDFVWRLLGKIPSDPASNNEVLGAAELDKDGIPIPQFPVRMGVEWDGSPRTATPFNEHV